MLYIIYKNRLAVVQHGFTLLEVMVTVAIIAILSAIAYPAYSDYVLRGQLIEASTTLSTMRASMEQYYLDNRTYKTITAGTIESPCDTLSVNNGLKYFTISCPAAEWTDTTYTLKASGNAAAPTAGFTYSINQAATQSSTVNGAWGGTTSACWIMKKGSTC